MQLSQPLDNCRSRRGAVLAVAYENNLTRDQFLNSMLVAYETIIHSGATITDYYQYAIPAAPSTPWALPPELAGS